MSSTSKLDERITVKTRDFDEIQISERDIITFPDGLFAFEESKRFFLISPLGEGRSPVWLQSVDDPSLCFILFSPFEFCSDYSVTVSDNDMDFPKPQDKDALYYVIAMIPEHDNMSATVNLKSPLIINTRTRKAVQIIADENYPIKFPVFAKESG